jgi:hypothetical protein
MLESRGANDMQDGKETVVAMTDIAGPTSALLEPGTEVEVRSKFENRWARGFEIIEPTNTGYRLRRLSDGEELPVIFDFDNVRREKKRDYWWY